MEQDLRRPLRSSLNEAERCRICNGILVGDDSGGWACHPCHERWERVVALLQEELKTATEATATAREELASLEERWRLIKIVSQDDRIDHATTEITHHKVLHARVNIHTVEAREWVIREELRLFLRCEKKDSA